ncbi:Uncharacterised protein [Yersinia kristensenii]|nr:Uncharacterised protein [Yersinia kristensenii]
MKPFSPRWGAVCLMLILAGCSSPPEPVAVNWDATPTTVNSTLPQWQENNIVVRSPNLTGEWSKRITDFQGDRGTYGSEFYYAVAHSTRIVVASNSSTAWFNTKAWLQMHGAVAPIEFNRRLGCLTCNTVDVYLSR